jgi:hypothetical protein
MQARKETKDRPGPVKPNRARALVAVGRGGTNTVVATDDPTLEFECGDIADNCDDLGLGDGTLQPGLYLFEFVSGVQVWRNGHGEEDAGTEYSECVTRPVKPDELAELLALAAPDDGEGDDDGRE